MRPRLRPATTVPALAIEPVEGVRGSYPAEEPACRFADGCSSTTRARAAAARAAAVVFNSFLAFAFADFSAPAFSRFNAALTFAFAFFYAAFSSAPLAVAFNRSRRSAARAVQARLPSQSLSCPFS